MTVVWPMVSLLLLAALDSPQPSRGTTAQLAPADLVLPVPGTPISVEQSEERTHTLNNGSSRKETTTVRIYRDSFGRLRIESPTSVVLIDPVSGYRVNLLTAQKIAVRLAGPKSGQQGFAIGVGGMGEGLPAGNWKSKTEDLGTNVIEGVECKGSRTTQTSEDNPPKIATHERWYSSELKLTALATSSGPNWKHTAKIRILDRNEPDASLFGIPSDYKVQDLNLPRPGQQ